MKETVIVIFIIMIFIFYYLKFGKNAKDISYTKSSINEKFYLVRNLPDKKRAADTIANIVKDLKKLAVAMYKELKNSERNAKKMSLYIKRIYNRFDGISFRESSAYSPYTSYTVNKGDEMVLCIRSKKTGKIHNYNILMYVAIHELAHVGCTEIGHTPLFFKINKYMIKKAIKMGIYKYVDYRIYPQIYCGMKVNNNVI
jgi:hypothetical protein